MPPKKDATAEKIDGLQQSVTQIERHISSELATQREEVEGIRTRLENDIKKLLADQGKLSNELAALSSQGIEGLKRRQDDLQGEIGKADKQIDDLTTGIKDVAEEQGKVNIELSQELKQSLDRITELEKRPVFTKDTELEKKLSDMIHNLKSWTENQLTQSSERGSKEVDRLGHALWPWVVSSTAELDRRIAGLDSNLAGKLKDFESRLQKDMASSGAELQADLRRISKDVNSKVDDENAKNKTWIKGVLEGMEKDVESLREDVLSMSGSLNGAHTRSATWNIHGFRQKLFRMLQQRDLVLTSPAFTLCGQPDISLEMLALPEEAPDLAVPLPPIPVPGSCSIRIWAQPGLHLVFKLTLGEGPALSRRFEHNFKADGVMDSRGRSSFQMPNLCQLDDIWVKKSNTVKVKIEMLEMWFEAIEHHAQGIAGADDVKDVVPYTGAQGAASLTDMDEETKDATLAALVGEQDKEITDELTTARYLVADEVLREIFKGELQAVRNKSVRRVEWRLEGASRLLEMIRVGEAVDSSVFTAAGVDQMQLHFYPRGCDLSEKVSANAQACSFYLSGPQRTTIRGTLFVGSHSRQFEHRYQLRGDRGGRERFCKLDTMLDAEDSVTLAVEIAEVESDIADKASSLLWRNYSGPAKELNPLHSIPFGAAGGAKAISTGAKGILRMKREDPNKVEEVVRCMSLPTLNTRAHFLPQIAGQRKGR